MNYQDTLKISEMEEGNKYACTQQGHGYSDGVWMTKRSNEIEIRHFWKHDKSELSEDGYYFFDETDQVCYPKKAEDDQTDIIHSDIMQVIPEAITYQFEDMTLGDFYDVVFMGIYYMASEDHIFPSHVKDMRRVFSRDGKFLYGLNLSA